MVFGLFDYDPYGIMILRTYQHKSIALQHEKDSFVESIIWIGITSKDVRVLANDDENAIPMSKRDFRMACTLLPKCLETNDLTQLREVQRMIILGYKLEIQALDENGDISSYMDTELLSFA